MRFSTLTSAAAFFELSIAGYVLQDDYMTDFYGAFDFFTGEDPTEGFVQYVDEATARQTNLINSSATSAVSWGVDAENKTPEGRPSIRIESKKSYNTGLIVLDVAHMPFGCGTWPAFWTIGPDWPQNGEIDILEGVNEQTNNGMTLHTGPGCQIGQDIAQFAGELNTGNCDIAAKGQGKNVGCSIEHPSKQSYGAGLNQIGGGVYATQWTSEAISVYFFPRDSIPADVLGDNPDPSGWGKPAAMFTGDCDIEKTFHEQKMIFDTTFCGQWAGSSSVWDTGSCGKKAATCEEWVRDNPEAFAEAYWTINGLKVYQDNGEAPAPESSSAPGYSTAISVPLPVSTINTSFPTSAPPVIPIDLPSLIIPSVSGIFAPIPTSEVLSGLPSKTPTVPVAPLPTGVASSAKPSSKPLPTKSRGAASPVKPTPQAPAQTGANGMPGFQWPGDSAGQPDDAPAATTSAASAPEPTDAPVQNSTGGAAAPSPSTLQSIAQSSSAPVVSESPAPAPLPTNTNDTPPAIPVLPVVTETVGAVHTVYETFYATVTARAAETPAPDARKARMQRHLREHRQRLTKHHARH
ncbi:hypothetical protein EJ02DRAFT_109735 [Clathrospora elynae]|uniref:endo-1,3(4)-beta-glucanase n=1 Tax=Clathrospora elynae TaxID=706981 RepID=A0A6A5T096_9PLEO|nr:hypothetical protein EJ02DRAFT_109735 [Clathrospora elynae]